MQIKRNNVRNLKAAHAPTLLMQPRKGSDREYLQYLGRERTRWYPALLSLIVLVGVLFVMAASLSTLRTSLAADDPDGPDGPGGSDGQLETPFPLASPTLVARPVLTPSTEFGGMPVVYAGAGDGSWPDQMEPNDGASDPLGPAPVDVGTLYRSLNLLPRTEPQANPTPGEDRDWYVWNASGGRCYRAFTGDIAWHGSSGDSGGQSTQSSPLTGRWKVQHAIRIWWYPPVKEGRKMLAEYAPDKGPAEGGYFAASTACADVDGPMAAEVYNNIYALKNPRGLTYTFGVLDVGAPQVQSTGAKGQSESPGSQSGTTENRGKQPVNSSPVQPPSSAPPSIDPSNPSQVVAFPPSPTASPSALPIWTPMPSPTDIPVVPVPPTETLTSFATPSITPSPRPGSEGLPASVDVVAYLDRNQNGAPDPGEGLHGLQVALLSVRTNSVQMTASTNLNGYARLDWTWAGRVRIALPDLSWSDLVDPYDMAAAARSHSDVWSMADDGTLYLEVRVLPARLPAVIP